MEAFEEWLKHTGFKEMLCFDCGGISKEDLQPVWRAALEWLLSKWEDEEPYTNESLLLTMIRKELG